MASGLDPDKALNVYPESMSRSLLNAALLRAELPPTWVMEILKGITNGLGGNKVKKPKDNGQRLAPV